jgi:hypothetical protein
VAAGVALHTGLRPDTAHVGLADLVRGGLVRAGSPDPTRGFVGAVTVLAALGGLGTREGRWLGGAGLACALAGVLTGGLHLVPAAALLACAGALASVGARARAATAGAVAVLLAAAIVLGGARGLGVRGSVSTAPLAVPEPVRRLPPGPVLDLPLAPGQLRERLIWQRAHGRPVAFDSAGLVDPEVLALATALARPDGAEAETPAAPGSSCPDPRRQGFRSLVVRREAEFRDLGRLVACLGPPSASAGDLAVWDLARDAP